MAFVKILEGVSKCMFSSDVPIQRGRHDCWECRELDKTFSDCSFLGNVCTQIIHLSYIVQAGFRLLIGYGVKLRTKIRGSR